MKPHETRHIRSERRRAFVYLGELFVIAVLEFVAGLGMLLMTQETVLSVILVLLSVLSLYFGVMASAYFESIRLRGDRPTGVKDIAWAAPKLRLYVLFANAGLIAGATILLWSAYSTKSGLVVWPAAILCFVGLRAIFMARDYHQARVRELESRE